MTYSNFSFINKNAFTFTLTDPKFTAITSTSTTFTVSGSFTNSPTINVVVPLTAYACTGTTSPVLSIPAQTINLSTVTSA